MIKLARYAFNPIDNYNMYINFMDFGDCIGFDSVQVSNLYDLDFKLSEGMVYSIAFDQSTSNTGIFIKNYNNTEVYLMEISRTKDQDAYQYMFDLELLLGRISEGSNILYVVYEQPIKTSSYRSSQVLFALEATLRGLPRRFESFSTASLDTESDSSWVSKIKNSKYSNYPRKDMTMYSVLDKFPWAKHYGLSIGKDNDVFESIGVMYGWFKSSYDINGNPYVKGSEFQGSIGCYLLPDVSASEVCDNFNDNNIKAKWGMYNPSLSVYENISRFAEKNTVSLISTDNKHVMLNLFVLAGWRFIKMDNLTIMIVTPNYMDNRIYDIAGKEFCFVF